MAGEFLDVEQQPERLIPDYLGAPAATAFRNQPALPITGAAAVGGTAPATPGGDSAPGPAGNALSAPQSSAQAGVTVGGTPTALQLARLALSAGGKLSDIASVAFGGGPAGAIQTPSGQLTNTAPEILRDQQFPAFDDQVLSEMAPTQAVPTGAVGDLIGPGVSSLTAIANFVQALMRGDPQGIFQGGLGLASVALPAVEGVVGGIEAGSVGAGIAAGSAAAEAIAPWLAVAAPVLQGLGWNVFGGPTEDRRDVARGQSGVEARDVPAWWGNVLQGAETLGRLSPEMSDADLMSAYTQAREGVAGAQALAEPFARSGSTIVPTVNWPDLSELRPVFDAVYPANLIAVARIQDMMAARGIQIPTDTPDIVTGAFDRPDMGWTLDEARRGWSFQGIESSGEGSGLTPGPVVAGPTLTPLSVADLVGAAAPYGGVEGAVDPGRIAGIAPGQIEAGLRGLFSELGGERWAASPLAQYWAALSGENAQPSGGGAISPSPDVSAALPGAPTGSASGPGMGAPGLAGGERLAEEALALA